MPKLGQRPNCLHCTERFAPKHKGQRFCSRLCADEGRKAASVARFRARVVAPGDDACHLYTGPRNPTGHGSLWWFGRTELAHRVAWELANGPIPPGVCVLHNCPGGDNPACVNPRHLWLGTKGDNNADRHQKGRDARGERSGAVMASKLCADDIRAIRASLALGTRKAALAREYRVGETCIHRIAKGETWRHVAPEHARDFAEQLPGQ